MVSLLIKYQSYPKLLKIDVFERKICICQHPKLCPSLHLQTTLLSFNLTYGNALHYIQTVKCLVIRDALGNKMVKK